MVNIDVEEAKRLYEDGWTMDRLAEHFGVSRMTVANRFHENGIPTRGKPQTIEGFDLEKAKKLYYEDGLSLEMTGRALGVSGTKIKNELLRNGCRVRKRHEFYAGRPPTYHYDWRRYKQNRRDYEKARKKKEGDENV